MSDAQVTILIPHFQTPDAIRLCLRSIRRYTAPPYRILVLDNGSSDASLDYLRRLAWVECVPTGVPNDLIAAQAAALNVGAERVATPYLPRHPFRHLRPSRRLAAVPARPPARWRLRRARHAPPDHPRLRFRHRRALGRPRRRVGRALRAARDRRRRAVAALVPDPLSHRRFSRRRLPLRQRRAGGCHARRQRRLGGARRAPAGAARPQRRLLRLPQGRHDAHRQPLLRQRRQRVPRPHRPPLAPRRRVSRPRRRRRRSSPTPRSTADGPGGAA